MFLLYNLTVSLRLAVVRLKLLLDSFPPAPAAVAPKGGDTLPPPSDSISPASGALKSSELTSEYSTTGPPPPPPPLDDPPPPPFPALRSARRSSLEDGACDWSSWSGRSSSLDACRRRLDFLLFFECFFGCFDERFGLRSGRSPRSMLGFGVGTSSTLTTSSSHYFGNLITLRSCFSSRFNTQFYLLLSKLYVCLCFYLLNI